MINRKNILIIFLVALNFGMLASCYAEDNDFYELSDINRKFTELYRGDYNNFWESIYSYEDKFKKCKSHESVLGFLILADPGYGNAEFAEYYNEIVEYLLVNHTECILNLFEKLSDKTKKIVTSVSVYPHSNNELNVVNILNKHKSDNGYNEFMALRNKIGSDKK